MTEKLIVRHGDEELIRAGAAVPRSSLPLGKFGRMFRTLPAFQAPDDLLKALGAPGGPMEDGGRRSGDNEAIPAGFTYLGQFIDHDITFDPVSKMARSNDPDALHNFRTPAYDLDSVYGLGPNASPHLYNKNDPNKLLGARNPARELDLPRNSQQTALIGDPRNDENILVSQMHVSFIHFHNKIVDHLTEKKANFDKHRLPGEALFDVARRLVRWHYQWMIVHSYLSKIVGKAVVDSLLSHDARGRPVITNVLYEPQRRAFMPVEFSAAAFRFGHSMIRTRYDLNNTITADIFGGPQSDPLSHLGGSRMLPESWQIRWPLFFQFPNGRDPQPSRLIDAKLAKPLMNLPATVIGERERDEHRARRSLAVRNLLRSKALGLPSGQAVAAEMGETALSNSDLGLSGSGWGGEAPLWFYILKESERAPVSGKRLGPVGGRIVAEVLLGLLRMDKTSYVHSATPWKPTRPIAPKAGTFSFVDLVQFADTVKGDA